MGRAKCSRLALPTPVQWLRMQLEAAGDLLGGRMTGKNLRRLQLKASRLS